MNRKGQEVAFSFVFHNTNFCQFLPKQVLTSSTPRSHLSLKLMGIRRGSANSNVEKGMGFRMSALGLEICEAITEFQEK